MRTDALEHVETVDARQLQIEQDDLRQRRRTPAVHAGAEEIVERLDAVARHHDFVGDVAFSKRPQRQLDIVRVVFDEKNFIHSRQPSVK